MRPRRSLLYMPGANARAMEKARSLDCDTVIFDLEDAVSPDAKEKAREQVLAAVASGAYGHRVVGDSVVPPLGYLAIMGGLYALDARTKGKKE